MKRAVGSGFSAVRCGAAAARFLGSSPESYVAEGTVKGFVGAVGNTPLIKLRGVSEETGCDILAKAEFMNPGGSVKDRAALYIVRDAEEKGHLRKGGEIVEGTAGNTGIGLAHIAAARGYKCKIFIPDTQAREKIDLLRALGADVEPVPAVPYDDPLNFNHRARAYAEGKDNCVYTDQFDNVANRYGHFLSTGPEIWKQTGGKIDAFTCATGTGGTLAGVALYLKQKRSDVQIVLADPPGAVLYEYIQTGEIPTKREGSSITEGIGQGRVTDNLDGAPIDWALRVWDPESVAMTFRLLSEEGLFLGASSGLNVVAAVEVAKKLGPGHTVVTILCDSATRYMSRLFSRSWLAEKQLLDSLEHKHLSMLSE